MSAHLLGELLMAGPSLPSGSLPSVPSGWSWGLLPWGSLEARTVVLAQAKSLGEVIENLRTIITGLLAGLATLMLLIGGTLYLLAGGDPARIENAKTAMKSAAGGYVLAVLAPVLLTLLQQVVA